MRSWCRVGSVALATCLVLALVATVSAFGDGGDSAPIKHGGDGGGGGSGQYVPIYKKADSGQDDDNGHTHETFGGHKGNQISGGENCKPDDGCDWPSKGTACHKEPCGDDSGKRHCSDDDDECHKRQKDCDSDDDSCHKNHQKDCDDDSDECRKHHKDCDDDDDSCHKGTGCHKKCDDDDDECKKRRHKDCDDDDDECKKRREHCKDKDNDCKSPCAANPRELILNYVGATVKKAFAQYFVNKLCACKDDDDGCDCPSSTASEASSTACPSSTAQEASSTACDASSTAQEYSSTACESSTSTDSPPTAVGTGVEYSSSGSDDTPAPSSSAGTDSTGYGDGGDGTNANVDGTSEAANAQPAILAIVVLALAALLL